MALWDQSERPGEMPSDTQKDDVHIPRSRPADGAQNGTTNRTDVRSVNTRLVIKDSKILFVRADGSIAGTFSIIPEVSTTSPIFIIANEGYDVYTDILGISRPI